ncbi:DEKNAAC103241 [Brettanomyces naardenensis]|uniref:DEKNAAC103241 n=1 Tax=Brettanomyces naardenensis TaxID=13370 RepID=A0A448YMY8_BRENA|nr:DEKNAAC103241 [Brettanomyces naardenensis]
MSPEASSGADSDARSLEAERATTEKTVEAVSGGQRLHQSGTMKDVPSNLDASGVLEHQSVELPPNGNSKEKQRESIAGALSYTEGTASENSKPFQIEDDKLKHAAADDDEDSTDEEVLADEEESASTNHLATISVEDSPSVTAQELLRKEETQKNSTDIIARGKPEEPGPAVKSTRAETSSDDDDDDDPSFDEEEHKEFFARKRELTVLREELRNQIAELEEKKDARGFNLDRYLKNCQLLKDYSNLPSFDFDKRLELIKLFYRDMTILDVNHDQVGPTLDDQAVSFTIEFSRLVSYRVNLKFSQKAETISSLTISQSENQAVTTELDQIGKLISYCQKRKDVSLFIFAINSYIRLFKRRTQMWIDLFLKFLDRSSSINGVASTDSTASKGNRRLMAFALFRSSPSFEIAVGRRELYFNWSLYFPLEDNSGEPFIGDCKSEISSTLFVDNNETVKDQVIDLSDAVNGIIRTDGAYDGFCRLLGNVL